MSADVPAWRRRASLAALVVPIAVVAVVAWQRRWMSDDGFINVRVVANLFAGNGPVFNAGERVEVGTSTLWLVVLAAGRVLFPYASTELFAVLAGLTATVAGLTLATMASTALWRRQQHEGIALPVGTVVLAALPPVWDFATSGLESGLTTLWLGASFWLLVRRPTTAVAAIVIGLGPLVRPDLGLIAVALGAPLLLHAPRSWRGWSKTILVASAAPLAYEVFRAGYYGMLVPNTAIAKGAGSSMLDRGVAYLDDFGGRYLLVLPIALAIGLLVVPLALELRRARRWPDLAVVVAPIAGGIAHALYVVRVGGDFMHGRLLLPATLAVLLPVSAVVARPRQLLAVGGVAVWAVLVGTTVRVPYGADPGPDGIADERRWYVARATTSNPIHVEDFDTTALSWFGWGTAARDAAARGEQTFVDVVGRWPAADGYGHVFRFGSIGIVGVRAGLDVHVADFLALANPVGAHLDVPVAPDARVGHGRVVPLEWDYARFARPAAGDSPGVVAARAALACGELRELVEDVTAPMSLGRFVGNLFDAPRLTRLRIPADPADAEAVLCG